uniref:G_PROTEIN_RECEP_F1_2 domain-containing protein n=2 Tax=Schistosoma mansoni TaxID=6183 RepID=A0A5K4F8S0_SCHMA
MSYQLFVLLSTYVLPFACILILNSCIVLKLKQKNVAERETNKLKRTSLHDSSIYTRNNNNSITNNISNTNESFNSSRKSTNWLGKKRRLFSIQQQCGSHKSDDIHENISHNYDNHPHHRRQQQQQHLEQQSSGDTTISDYNTNTTSNIGTGYRSSTKNSIQKCDFHENIQQNPNELIRATRELKKKRLRSKATKLVVLVTTLWGVCWLPTHIINSWFFFDEASFPFVPAMKIAKLLSQTLSFAASCVNPVVYTILTGSFKTALSNRLLRFRKRNKRNDHTKSEILYVTE